MKLELKLKSNKVNGSSIYATCTSIDQLILFVENMKSRWSA